jgi:diguanylate cyclase (GGDEF)-like protein
MSRRTTILRRVLAFFARSDDPYAGGDLRQAQRLGALVWVAGTVVTLVLVPFSPPVEAIGRWGWAPTALSGSVGLIISRRLLRGSLGWNQLLAFSYVAVAQIVLLQWLAGGSGAPYNELLIMVVVYAAGVHPPRRVLVVLAAVGVARWAPLSYGGFSGELAAVAATQLLMLTALALLACVLMCSVRAQRLSLRQRGDRAEHLARLDALTALPNRRALEEALAAEVARARRSARPLSVIVADLDDFKAINDAHGHTAGDACLQAVAATIPTALREYDTCFRWGGDEFVMVLPEADISEAEAICRRSSAAVSAQCASPAGDALRMTCAPAALVEGMTAGDVLAAADAELIGRKRGRRPRLVAA